MSASLVPASVATPAIQAAYGRIQDLDKFLDQDSAMCRAAISIMSAPKEQGPAIVLHAIGMGISVVDMARNYHWIQGRPSMRADAMLANFRQLHGGDYVVKERTKDRIEVEFKDRAGRTYPCSLTWEEVCNSPYPWKKDKGPGSPPTPENLKDNYATDMGRRSMMFARLVSDSLRFICPELVAGIYTPEEMAEIEPLAPAAPAEPPKTARQIVEEAAAKTSVTTETSPFPAAEEEVVDAEYTVADHTATAEPAAPIAPAVPVDPPATPATPPAAPAATNGGILPASLAEIEQLTERMRRHGRLTPERWAAALAKRQCRETAQLTETQAQELLVNLRYEVSTLPAEKN